MSNTRRRRRRAGRRDRFTPELAAFLATGDLEPARRKNVFFADTLTDARAVQIRDCFLAGDEGGARTLLARLPGRPDFFFE